MLLCAALVALPLALAPLAVLLGALVPLPVDVAPVDVAPVAAPVVVMRVAVAQVAAPRPLPPVEDELPVVRARRGVDGRYAPSIRCYAPARLHVLPA